MQFHHGCTALTLNFLSNQRRLRRILKIWNSLHICKFIIRKGRSTMSVTTVSNRLWCKNWDRAIQLSAICALSHVLLAIPVFLARESGMLNHLGSTAVQLRRRPENVFRKYYSRLVAGCYSIIDKPKQVIPKAIHRQKGTFGKETKYYPQFQLSKTFKHLCKAAASYALTARDCPNSPSIFSRNDRRTTCLLAQLVLNFARTKIIWSPFYYLLVFIAHDLLYSIFMVLRQLSLFNATHVFALHSWLSWARIRFHQLQTDLFNAVFGFRGRQSTL